MTHTCHADGCNVPIRPSLFMCTRHWRMVPLAMRLAVLQAYRPGQEDDKRPTSEYVSAAVDARRYVRNLEMENG